MWEDLVTVQGDEAFLTYQVYNEAIVVPETIDAIRALTSAVPDAATSMRITDETLGMRQDFLDEHAGAQHGRRDAARGEDQAFPGPQ